MSTAQSPLVDWLDRFREAGAIWQMASDHKLHVKTSMSGEHVDAYFNSDIISSQPKLVEEIINSVLVPIIDIKPDWVVSYAPYGLFVAYACARSLNASCGYTIPDNDYKTSFNIPESANVLVVADDMYSGGGVAKTIATLESMKINVLPVVFCLANLSGSVKLGNRDILAAATIPANRYSADNCLLCNQGFMALVPRPNWTQLNSN